MPELPENVVSPNGDSVAERQSLAYKIVRSSTVNARLVAPDGTEVPVDAGAKTSVGTFRLPPWSAPGPEGTWRFVVDATDDLGRTSSAERTFSLNNTLGALAVPSMRRGGSLRATFTLARPAQVRAAVLTAGGASLRGLPARQLGAGPQSLTWNGRTAYRSRVTRGRYHLRVTATNEIGTVSLIAPFTVTR